ncbi:inositol-pentakisphosphate 2-kinase [Phanerochaete sordida]|uniref:Inositol-pentakisphosphate 2-kinase n=1 Tax=Phanerochaete sordida TaxID=48140 RepID=A0A9P3G7W4_9APHY|nr:inositol-pentakisphosphate 2-kinase [Phanerochaete sordida]
MADPLDITVTSPRDWKYISEGGSSIVFSYVGPAHDSFGGTALRLRKALLSSPLDSPSLVIPPVDDPDDPAIAFQHGVVARVLPEEYLPRLEAVQVSRAWLEELAVLAETQRPTERRAKDTIDLQRTRAVLATDLVGGRVVAVEIKPKWGFLPSPTHLAPGTAPVKTTTCRFCMHAQVRGARDADADPAHAYCPLDLFSGEPDRVRTALCALWDTWVSSSGTTNNLRVFVHGHMVRPDATPTSIEALAAQLGLAGEFTLYTVRDAFVARVLPLLRETSVLRLLANLQRTLDPLDIEGLALLWSRAYASQEPGIALQTQSPDDGAPDASPLGAGLSDPTIDDWKEFLDVYFAKNAQMDHDHPDAADLKYYCVAYLLSATFKDCSLILRIPEDGAGSITLIDLDVKPISRLAKWQQLDKEIVEGYKNAWKPRQCIETK